MSFSETSKDTSRKEEMEKNRFSSKIQSIALLLGFSKSWFGFFDVFAVTARWFGSKRFLLL